MPTEETDVILSAMPAMLTVDVPNTIIITSDTTDTNIRYEYYLRPVEHYQSAWRG